MKLARMYTVAGIALATGATFAMFQGCGSSDDGSSPVPTAIGAQPPAKPGASPTADATERNFALRSMDFGENDGWKKLGFNLDGKLSTSASVDVCKSQGTDKSAHNNGNNGIDNAFGQKIVPLIGQFTAITTTVTQALQDGAFTVMIDTHGLSDDPKQTATGLTGQIFAGAAFDPSDAGIKPTFTPSDHWPVRPELLANASDATKSSIAFADAYVNGGTWVNGSGAVDVKLTLAIAGRTLQIAVHHAIITFDHAAPAHAANGVIAGVIGTGELVTAIAPIVGAINPALCNPAIAATIVTTLKGASDILQDATQDPSKTCDGISVGLGFTADQIAPPKAVAPAAGPADDPCAAASDAGPDASDAG